MTDRDLVNDALAEAVGDPDGDRPVFGRGRGKPDVSRRSLAGFKRKVVRFLEELPGHVTVHDLLDALDNPAADDGD